MSASLSRRTSSLVRKLSLRPRSTPRDRPRTVTQVTNAEASGAAKCFEEHRIRLSTLPAEIIGEITRLLDQGNRICLSMTCVRLYRVVSSSFDLRLQGMDLPARFRIMHQLEPAWPEYLTCRRCGRLYKWSLQEGHDYRCPCYDPPKLSGIRSEDYCYEDRVLRVSRAMVDLILRTVKFGPAYGLQPDILKTRGTQEYWIQTSTAARVVEGELLFLALWQGDFRFRPSAGRVEATYWPFSLSACHHAGRALLADIIAALDAFAQDTAESKELELPKCRYCNTDGKLCMRRLAKNEIRVGLKWWRSLGSVTGLARFDDQMFNCYRWNPTPSAILAQRHLQADFEAVEGADDLWQPRPRFLSLRRWYSEHF